jgi:hypothetical protein
LEDDRGIDLISDALPFGRLFRRARCNRVRQGSDLVSDGRCDAHQKIAVPTSIGASARCFPNDQGLFALLHIAEIALESQMAKNPAAPCATEDFYTRLRDSATGR